MKSKLSASVIFAILAFLPFSTYAELKWANTKLDFQAKFGDKKLSGVYKFTNIGEEEVLIDYVKASCGCTTPTLTKKYYAPGESGEINVTFDIGTREGKQHKTISVMTNKGKKEYKLFLNANIPELLKIQPRALFWKKNGELTPKKVDIKIAIDKPVGITVLSDSSTFKAEVEAVKKGKHYIVTITPRYLGDATRRELLIQTNYPEKKPLKFKIYTFVK